MRIDLNALFAIDLTPDDIQKHGEALVSSLEIDALIHGNLSKDVSLDTTVYEFYLY